MKNLFFLSLFILILSACSDDIKDEPANISISETVFAYGRDGGVAQVNITCNTQWNIVSDSEWCTVLPESGKNDGVITITIAPNYSTERIAKIVVEVPGAKDPIISITQAGILGKLPVKRTITGTQDYETYEYNGLFLNKISSYVNNDLATILIFTYDGENLKKTQLVDANGQGISHVEYTRNNQTVNCNGTGISGYERIDLEGDLPTRIEYNDRIVNYSYDHKNVSKQTVYTKSTQLTINYDYMFDNKKGIFSYCKTPAWWFIYQNVSYNIGNNLVNKYQDNTTLEAFTYGYDQSDYPASVKYDHINGTSINYTFEYKEY